MIAEDWSRVEVEAIVADYSQCWRWSFLAQSRYQKRLHGYQARERNI